MSFDKRLEDRVESIRERLEKAKEVWNSQVNVDIRNGVGERLFRGVIAFLNECEDYSQIVANGRRVYIHNPKKEEFILPGEDEKAETKTGDTRPAGHHYFIVAESRTQHIKYKFILSGEAPDLYLDNIRKKLTRECRDTSTEEPSEESLLEYAARRAIHFSEENFDDSCEGRNKYIRLGEFFRINSFLTGIMSTMSGVALYASGEISAGYICGFTSMLTLVAMLGREICNRKAVGCNTPPRPTVKSEHEGLDMLATTILTSSHYYTED